MIQILLILQIINQIYTESLKNIGSTGDNLNESLIYYKREDPLIFKLINDDPKILEMLYEIRDMEDKQEYLTRLDALIFQCESYLHKNESTKDNTSCHLKQKVAMLLFL